MTVERICKSCNRPVLPDKPRSRIRCQCKPLPPPDDGIHGQPYEVF